MNAYALNRLARLGLAITAAALLTACGDGNQTPAEGAEHGAAAAADYERGPHRGRMLRDGDFAVEMTIFEEGVDPEFHVYAYRKDKPIDPRQVQLTVELARLGGRVDRFAFAPQSDYLRGNGVVTEPHSFDVKVRAVEGGRTHQWAYPSYEGRTTISAEAAQAGGVKTERAGPVLLAELVESSQSLQTYAIPAPIGGVIVQKNANVGDVASDQALFVIADPTKLHAEFFVYPRDAERVRVGQKVEVRSLSGETRIVAPVEAILPTADMASQTLMAHVHLPPGAAATFRPGMGVEGSFQVATQQASLAVRTKALQRFRDFTVVFAKVGDTYEVRMLELGRRTPEWTEVLGGLEPGTEYVTDGAFLIRADIDKSGASHDH